jgi:hypothetical protein
MNLQEFKSSLKNESPPKNISPLLAAMWYDAKGNWNEAHNIAQSIGDKNGSLIHAYLHRKEGDDSNASYWYSKAGKSFPSISLEDEWEKIVNELI